MRLFVANFIQSTEESELRYLFERYGEVRDVAIWVDYKTGESKEFGFVDMPEDSCAERAIRKLNGKEWNGRRLKVSEARSQSCA